MLCVYGNIAWVFAMFGWLLVITKEYNHSVLRDIIGSEIERQCGEEHYKFLEEAEKKLEEHADEIVKEHHLYLQQHEVIAELAMLRTSEQQKIVNGVDDILETHKQYRDIADKAVDHMNMEISNGN